MLASAGIAVRVLSDDCGAVDPALDFARGVQVLVARSDRAAAERFLAEGVASGTD